MANTLRSCSARTARPTRLLYARVRTPIFGARRVVHVAAFFRNRADIEITCELVQCRAECSTTHRQSMSGNRRFRFERREPLGGGTCAAPVRGEIGRRSV